jgi:hypothetical protein
MRTGQANTTASLILAQEEAKEIASQCPMNLKSIVHGTGTIPIFLPTFATNWSN